MNKAAILKKNGGHEAQPPLELRTVRLLFKKNSPMYKGRNAVNPPKSTAFQD